MTNPTTSPRTVSGELQNKAEHRKFYYCGEHVILTSKAGCSVLDEAKQLLANKFVGKPLTQKCQAVGDGQRPQHMIVMFAQNRIIITGKKSSDMVSQVYELLNSYFNSGCQSILSAGNNRPSNGASRSPENYIDKNDLEKSIPEIKIAETSLGMRAQTDHWDSNCDSFAVTGSKEQKRLGLNSQPLFSKAITELRKRSKSNERKRIQRSPPSKSSPVVSEMTSEMNLADNSIIEVGNPIPASESKSVEPLIYGSNPTTNVLSKSQDAEEMSLESSVNSNTILSNEKLSFLKVGEVDPNAKKIESCDKATNAVSEDKSTQSLEGAPIQYERDVILHLSLSSFALMYPHHLIVTTDCEILVSPSNMVAPFDPSKHRLPETDLAMSNVFSAHNTYSGGSRKGDSECQPVQRHFSYTSDPWSWGDSSGNTRYRKYPSVPADVLYSESAYNCMTPAPESATFCTELDAVFKNRSKVVPGVTFTKRPRESLNSEHIRELLEYYEPQGK